jgi:hypothetical protein
MGGMMSQRWQIAYVYHLLATCGPETAYTYMEQHGGLACFPWYLIAEIRAAIVTDTASGAARLRAERHLMSWQGLAGGVRSSERADLTQFQANRARLLRALRMATTITA